MGRIAPHPETISTTLHSQCVLGIATIHYVTELTQPIQVQQTASQDSRQQDPPVQVVYRSWL